MINLFTAIGRLTKDPELRKSGNDVSFATMTIAIDNPIKESDGTRGTTFLDCRLFKEQAENLVKYTRKGSKIAISGSLIQRNFVRKDGSKGSVIEVIVNNVEYLDPKSTEQDNTPDEEPQEVNADELPFEPAPEVVQEPKYDPYTGKPLGKPSNGKNLKPSKK